MRRPILILLFAILLTGCATRITTTSVQRLVPLQTSSSYHPLWYVGSDDQFHYFSHLNLKYYTGYRVPRSELAIPETFARDSGKSTVMWPGSLEKMMR